MMTAPLLFWWRLSAAVFAVAMAFAVAVVVFRLPMAGLADPVAFRIALALHVQLAINVWLWTTAALAWVAAAGRWALPVGRVAAIGVVLLVGSSLWPATVPRMADYFPWLDDNPLYALGTMLTGAAILALAAFGLRRGAAGGDRLPAGLVWIALLTALGAGVRGADGPALAWVLGHQLLYAHVALMLSEWRALDGAVRPGGRLSGTLLLAPAIGAGLMTWLGLDRLFGTDVHTAGMVMFLWLPPALYLAAGRHRTGRPHSPVVLTAAAFLVAGCVLGALIDGPTTLVTAHYHATMGAVALTRMANLYRTGLPRPAPAAASRQLATYALSLVLLTGGLAVAGLDASPRKTSAAEMTQKTAAYRTGMALSGVGGLLAIVGSVWFVINIWPRRQATGKDLGHGTATT